MTTPKDLVGHVNHVIPSSPEREILLRMAQEIELLKTRVFGSDRPKPPIATVTTPHPIPEGETVSTEDVAEKTKGPKK